jgi:hypothetical protein
MGKTQMFTTKISRRLFNGIMAVGALFGLQGGAKAKPIANEFKQELEETDYMEVLIIPEEFRPPYSPKVKEVISNHLKAGKSRYEIKEFILSQAKVIKVPLK